MIVFLFTFFANQEGNRLPLLFFFFFWGGGGGGGGGGVERREELEGT